MGSSISLICCPNESANQRGDVLVIKEDGEPLKFKDGTLVKDVLSAYPYHNIIRCCSERTVLLGETQLNCIWIYFLLPVGLALSEAAYQNLVRYAVSPNLSANGADTFAARFRIVENNQNGYGGIGQGYMLNDSRCSYKWKPHLRTIPEISTPSA